MRPFVGSILIALATAFFCKMIPVPVMGDGRATGPELPLPYDDEPAQLVMKFLEDDALPDHLTIDAFGTLDVPKESWRRKFERIVIPPLPHNDTMDPHAEIHLASLIYGVSERFMLSVAEVESDFNPREDTGQYKGLFQLSDYEFALFGHGDIHNARDNAQAFANMVSLQAMQFEVAVGHYPDFAERYMIHQQGIQGAIEHYANLSRPAWQSMCATDEGQEKGADWCRRAIWDNTLPAVKTIARTVDALTSGAFVMMWTLRLDHLMKVYDR